MKRYSVVLWLVLLCLIVSSCTSYRVAGLPGSMTNMNHSGDARIVGSGANVRILLHSGETVKGAVTQATNGKLVLGHAGNYGVEEVSIPLQISRRLS